jgi:hypothetical protein
MNPILLLRNVCFKGTASSDSTGRSIVAGIKEQLEVYDLDDSGIAFLETITDQLYCLGATAVSKHFHVYLHPNLNST